MTARTAPAVLGTGEQLVGSIQADPSQRPTQQVVGETSQEIGSGVEEVGAHANELAALTGEKNCKTHRPMTWR
jgi:hypothetical protein